MLPSTAQKGVQLYSAFHLPAETKACTKQADICQMFKMLVGHTWTLQLYPQNGSDKTEWIVSICGDSNSIGW